MKLTFHEIYKSISSFPEVELPNFVVLTGVNGAGKSHLLEAIESGYVLIDDIVIDKTTKPIRRFDWTNLVPQDTGAFAPYQITQERHAFWNEITQQIALFKPHLTAPLRQHNRLDLMNYSPRQLVSLTPEELIASGNTQEEAQQIVHEIHVAATSASTNVAARFIQNDPGNRQRLISLLQDNSNVPLIALEEDEFYYNFPSSWQSIDMFQQSFGRLFAAYQRNWLNNQLKHLANSKGESIPFLTDKQFLDNFGEPPWVFVNSILETANLDFRINQPTKYEDRPYEPILTDQVRASHVRFSDLSSGEKILMSFALCLYYAQDRRQIVDYPKVLLFDEIDAPLHPSMTQSLLRTIQEVLVNRHGIKVILTTHSPSTVALSNEEWIYAMSKTDQRRVKKTTKDEALTILTTGVPTLSIDYENRRQVFVESHYDVEFYEPIYEKLRERLVPNSLTFIASGVAGKGNCAQVKEVVNQLYQGGSRTVYGIIDWDLANLGNDRVKVLGQQNRYSIENYILDPILIAAFLLREKWIERSTLGLSEKETFLHLAMLDSSRLQAAADFIVNKVKAQLSPTPSEDKVNCYYIGGQMIELPTWYLHSQGHELEAKLKEAFPQLNRFKQEPQLKREILSKIIDEIPALISQDFLSLFKGIQNIG
jgi:AAA15 family ATPase/GTPase